MPSFLSCPRCLGEGRPKDRPVHRPKCPYCDGLGLVEVDVLPRWVEGIRRYGPSCPSPFVAVIGSGIGGTALVLALIQRGIPVRVFEKDKAFNVRAQGYSLTMQQGTLSLAKLGIAVSGTRPTAHIAFLADGTVLGKYGRETHYVGDPTTNANIPLLAKCHKDRHNIQLPRQRLRALLLRELCGGTIEWGMKFQSYVRQANDGLYTIRFLTHHQGTTSSWVPTIVPGAVMVVGADGIYSNVFAQKFGLGGDGATLTNRLSYLGVIVILGISLYEDERLAHRVTQTLDGVTRIYTMPFMSAEDVDDTRAASKFPSGRNLTMWQLSFPTSLEEAMNLHKSGGEGLKREALARCEKWHSPIPELLRATNPEDITGYPAFDRDVMDVNEFRHGVDGNDNLVTVLGDAAHPMSPFKGQGANQALVDAVALAKRIACCYHHESRKFEVKKLVEEVSVFEKDMLQRAGDKVTASRTASSFLHSKRALTPGNCIRSEAMFDALENNTMVLAEQDRMIKQDGW